MSYHYKDDIKIAKEHNIPIETFLRAKLDLYYMINQWAARDSSTDSERIRYFLHKYLCENDYSNYLLQYMPGYVLPCYSYLIDSCLHQLIDYNNVIAEAKRYHQDDWFKWLRYDFKISYVIAVEANIEAYCNFPEREIKAGRKQIKWNTKREMILFRRNRVLQRRLLRLTKQ